MSVSDLLYPVATLRSLLETSEADIRRGIFQVMDTLTWFHVNEGYIPAARALPLTSEHRVVKASASFIEGLMASRSPYIWAVEFATLNYLRPDGPKAPVLQLNGTGLEGRFIENIRNVPSIPGGRHLVVNRDHALELDWKFQTMHNKKGVTEGIDDCNDFPETDSERREYVARLVKAMTDFGDIVEAPVAARPPKRAKHNNSSEAGADDDVAPTTTDNYRVRRVKNTSVGVLTVLAWKVLFAIKDAQDGRIFLPDHHGRLAEYTAYPDFKQRFMKVEEALKKSKCLVDDLLLWDPLRRVVANPEQGLARKKSNKDGNDKKTKALKIGAKIVKEEKARKSDTTQADKGTDTQQATNGADAKEGQTEKGAEKPSQTGPSSKKRKRGLTDDEADDEE